MIRYKVFTSLDTPQEIKGERILWTFFRNLEITGIDPSSLVMIIQYQFDSFTLQTIERMSLSLSNFRDKFLFQNGNYILNISEIPNLSIPLVNLKIFVSFLSQESDLPDEFTIKVFYELPG